MGIRNGIIVALAFGASLLAMTSIVYTDSYSSAAQAEAHGFHALTQAMRSDALLSSAKQGPVPQ
ncbi:hypothetical protein HSX11_05480 [Oxalobacteraceae bacterium]|nr:hypothetical protein [Oxalobacteraceae bacterium]